MTLPIGRTLGRGVRRALSVSGVVLLFLTMIAQSLVLGAVNTALQSALPAELQNGQIGVTIPVSNSVAGGLAVAGILLGTAVTVVGARALVRDVSELNSLPAALFTRRLGRALLSALVAGLVVAVSVTLGSLLIVPGLFLSVSFLFVTFFVGVDDARALSALRRSWGLAAGNRWRLLALVLVAVAAFGSVSVATGVVSIVDIAAAQALNLVVSSVISVAYLGIVAEAYRQLRDSSEGAET